MNDTAPGSDVQEFNALDGSPRQRFLNVSGLNNPLARKLRAGDGRAGRWLLDHVIDRHDALNRNMNGWRGKMAKWERMSEDDYSDRATIDEESDENAERSIFQDQNDTLGVSSGFVGFHFAQAKNDIFGTRPWLAASPEGKDDSDLADVMTKHAQWKFNQSTLEPVLLDALNVSTWGGTAFVQSGFRRDVEKYEIEVQAAYNPDTGEPYRDTDGDYITDKAVLLEMGLSKEQVEWRQTEVEETHTVYNNVSNRIIDYADISFETTAAELDLACTDVFVRSRRGFLDVVEHYGVDKEHHSKLLSLIQGRADIDVRDHRDESAPVTSEAEDRDTNPLVTIVEGYVRCAPFGGSSLSRIYVVFSPELRVMFAVDSLFNITPGGILPIKPVRVHKIPGRIFGRGYFEKHEAGNNAIDREYNGITFRNANDAHVYKAWNPEALDTDEEEEAESPFLDPTQAFRLRTDKTIDDLIQFKAAPDNNNRSENLLNMQMQMEQMKSGITSAAQGELAGVPSSNTATGTRDIQSRGAVIVKNPIDQQSADIRDIVEFNVLLLYANQDHDETFSWGEGRESVLLEIKAADVLDIRANVTLTLTQAQNQRKLESAMTAIDTVMKYIQIPEPDKPAARAAFVQALAAIGFHNAEDIIRPAATDLEGVLAMLPPEYVEPVRQALTTAGLITPEYPSPESATEEPTTL